MIIRSMNNEKEFPEGTTVAACLKALDAFPGERWLPSPAAWSVS